jgi:hypothetical protein
MYSTRTSPKRLKEDLACFNKFVTDHSSRDLRRNERLTVLNLAAECLVDYIQGNGRRSIVIRTDMLLKEIVCLRAAVNAAFPGACAAKLLDRIAMMPGVAPPEDDEEE